MLRKAMLNPAAIWRWGYTIVLVGFGTWLLIDNPSFGGADTRVMGWIVIGYGLARLLFYRLTKWPGGRRQ